MSLVNISSIIGFILSGCELHLILAIIIMLLAGLCDFLSRKYSLVMAGIVLSLGSILQAASFHTW